MKYNPKTNRIEVDVGTISLVYHELICAIRYVRELSGLPLDKYERKPGALTPADFAQRAILSAGNRLGIDMGAEWGEELDVRKL